MHMDNHEALSNLIINEMLGLGLPVLHPEEYEKIKKEGDIS